jgi:hypothetical protein
MNKATIDFVPQQIPVFDDTGIVMPLICPATFSAESVMQLARLGELTVKAIGSSTEPDVVIPKSNHRHHAVDSLGEQ